MSFDRQQAIYAAKLIETLYRGEVPPTLEAVETDTQVLIEQISEGRYAIAFPGTASAKDWLTDAKIRKTEWGPGRVHRGFAEAFRSVADAIQDRIPYGSHLIIAGHSLGGALATLCADALQDVYAIERVLTFGSPRSGNGRFVGEYNLRLADRTWRIVNSYDPIPHVPWVFGTYRHVATQVYLRADHTVQIDQPWRVAASEMLQTIEVATTGGATAKAFSISAAHHIHAYIRKLELLES